MMTTLIVLSLLMLAMMLYAGAAVVFLLVSVVLKLVWFGVTALFSLGWWVLALAAGAVLFVLKLTGVLAVVAMVLLGLLFVFGLGKLLGYGRSPARRLPSEKRRSARTRCFYAEEEQLSALRARFERLEKRLANLDTILSRR